MRLFIAVKLRKEVIAALCLVHNELKEKADKLRIIHPQNLHLTLFFLGNTPEIRIVEITKCLQDLGVSRLPFKLEFNNRWEMFETRNPAKVVWVGVKSDVAALRKLQTMIAATMHSLGFLRTEKMYIPHVTIARDVHFLAQYTSKEIDNDLFITRIPEMLVNNFSLIESCVENNKRIYKTIATFDFGFSEK